MLMLASHSSNNILIFGCFLIIYAQSIHLSRFNIYRRRTIPFILYSSSFGITGIALISMVIFLKADSAFNYSIVLYILGLLIKALGKLIYARQQNDEKVYKETLFPFKVMGHFVVMSSIVMVLASIIIWIIYKMLY
ncbi:hypothetical protein C6362_01600 [Megasphaera elsdenii DSM 20460]|nr:hypothetical protein C6362_01600 [Megasphaera elsdenii DSM 20460]